MKFFVVTYLRHDGDGWDQRLGAQIAYLEDRSLQASGLEHGVGAIAKGES